VIISRTFDAYEYDAETALIKTLKEARSLYPEFVWSIEHLATSKQHVTVYVRGILLNK
jgi:hypothetical protein